LVSVSYRAAWVPEQEYRDWDEAAAIAVGHVERECAEQGAAGMLVTETRDGARGIPQLEQFVARHSHHITRKSRAATRGSGPILVYVPYLELLELAAGKARGSSLCAVEAIGFKLEGWAAATGALNLDTGEVTPPPDTLLEPLEHLVFVGNNGWGDAYGKRDAGRIMPELRTLSADYVAGYVIGKGRSAAGAKRLREMIRRAGR
jgi:hypothetical protein